MEMYQDFSDAKLKEMIRLAMGKTNAGFYPEIILLSKNTWNMHAEVANRYYNDHCNIFLVGDAAHRFPPAGGFGMNTGMQDAHNLAWKLGYVVNGISSPKLLESYGTERQKIAQANTQFGLSNYDKSLKVAKVLGVDSDIAHWIVKSGETSIFSKIFPSFITQTGVRKTLELGASTLHWLGKQGHPLGEIRISALKKFIQSGNSLSLIFPHQDLNFSYGTNGTTTTTNNNNNNNDNDNHQNNRQSSNNTASSDFQISVGCRLPHAWFKAASSLASTSSSSSSSSSSSLSTLLHFATTSMGTSLLSINGSSNQSDSTAIKDVWFSSLDVSSYWKKWCNLTSTPGLSSSSSSLSPFQTVILCPIDVFGDWNDLVIKYKMESWIQVVPWESPSTMTNHSDKTDHEGLQAKLQEPRFPKVDEHDDIRNQMKHESSMISIHKLFESDYHRVLDNSESMKTLSTEESSVSWRLIDVTERWKSICMRYQRQTGGRLNSFPSVVLRPDGHVCHIVPSDVDYDGEMNKILKVIQIKEL